jgi:ankyrin repeat protein
VKAFFLGSAVCLFILSGVGAAQSKDVEALNRAIQLHDLSAVHKILDSGMNLDVYDEVGGTPLSEAIRNNLPDLAIELIMRGANPSYRSPMVGAAWYCYENVVRLMLSRGTPPDLQETDGATALLAAASNCSDEKKSNVVRVLLNAGANLNLADEAGHTPLIVAAKSGNERAVDLLIKAGADLNSKNIDGISARYIARHHPFRTDAHKRITDLLAKAGAKE